jgi:hypothetical protein
MRQQLGILHPRCHLLAAHFILFQNGEFLFGELSLYFTAQQGKHEKTEVGR